MTERASGFSGDKIAESRSATGTGRILKKKAVERNVLDLARERVREAFAIFDTVAVSFSGGKDSTVVLNLALEAAKELKRKKLLTFFYDEEAIPYETEHYVRRVSELKNVDLKWFCLPVKHRNACSRKSPYWYPWAPEAKKLWVRPLPPEAITHDALPWWPKEISQRPDMPNSVVHLFNAMKYGRVGMLMGIRASESLMRLRAILMSTKDSRPWVRPWGDSGNLFKVYPIYDWVTPDVWTAPKMLGWDYNRAYDMMEMCGMAHDDQRCAPPYGEQPMRGLHTFAACFPEVWDKMCCRVPGAATAARYASTELYSFNSRPEKPPGMPWREFIRLQVAKHPQPYRSQIAKRIKDWADIHCKKTSDPLAPRAPHPNTGLSWDFLLFIAIRGDYKGRKQVGVEGDPVKLKERYDAEVSAVPAEEIALWL